MNEVPISVVISSIGAICAVGGFLAALIKIWMDMGATRLEAHQAVKKADEALAELSNFKSSVAEKYVLQGALSASESRLTSSIDRLTERIDSLLHMVQGRHT